MTATQLPKPGDRFRWRGGDTPRTVVATTEHNVFYEFDDGRSHGSMTIAEWRISTIPIPPKPHVEPVQWGVVYNGRFRSAATEQNARGPLAAGLSGYTLAKVVNGVLFVEQGGEFVRAFGGDE